MIYFWVVCSFFEVWVYFFLFLILFYSNFILLENIVILFKFLKKDLGLFYIFIIFFRVFILVLKKENFRNYHWIFLKIFKFKLIMIKLLENNFEYYSFYLSHLILGCLLKFILNNQI